MALDEQNEARNDIREVDSEARLERGRTCERKEWKERASINTVREEASMTDQAAEASFPIRLSSMANL